MSDAAETDRPVTTERRDAPGSARSEGVVERRAGGAAARRTSAAPVVSAQLWEALDRAARVVRGAVHEAGLAEVELQGYLDALCEAVREAVAGETPRLRRLPPLLPARQLLERLRSRFLDEVAALGEPLESSSLVALLQGVDRVMHALDHDVAHRFASRLSSSDGMELIVEVAHDLRSPLASILFLSETLRKGQSGALNAIQERQLGLVYSAAFGLSALTSDVIELARGGERLLDLHPISFSISDIMHSVRDIVLPMAEEKGLGIQLTAPDGDLRAGHPSALNRVLLNLTTNALKFTAEGFVEVTGRQLSRTAVEFSVRDTGRGIPPEVVESLFEPFRRRLRPNDYAFSSAGLGLAICRKLVKAMGGELKLETAPDYGTRFYFTLDLPLASRL